MLTFNPLAYARIPARLVALAEPQPLGTGTPNESLRGPLANLATSREFTQGVTDPAMARCCQAGLWLAHNFLEESHALSQEVHTPCGSYWHGLLHRREGDFENAKYWFRATGAQHPVFPQVHAEARALAETAGTLERPLEFLVTQTEWNADAFVDACAAAVRGRVQNAGLVRGIAQFEWEVLFDYCYRAAFSG